MFWCPGSPWCTPSKNFHHLPTAEIYDAKYHLLANQNDGHSHVTLEYDIVVDGVICGLSPEFFVKLLAHPCTYLVGNVLCAIYGFF